MAELYIPRNPHNPEFNPELNEFRLYVCRCGVCSMTDQTQRQVTCHQVRTELTDEEYGLYRHALIVSARAQGITLNMAAHSAHQFTMTTRLPNDRLQLSMFTYYMPVGAEMEVPHEYTRRRYNLAENTSQWEAQPHTQETAPREGNVPMADARRLADDLYAAAMRAMEDPDFITRFRESLEQED